MGADRRIAKMKPMKKYSPKPLKAMSKMEPSGSTLGRGIKTGVYEASGGKIIESPVMKFKGRGRTVLTNKPARERVRDVNDYFEKGQIESGKSKKTGRSITTVRKGQTGKAGTVTNKSIRERVEDSMHEIRVRKAKNLTNKDLRY